MITMPGVEGWGWGGGWGRVLASSRLMGRWGCAAGWGHMTGLTVMSLGIFQ